jgi:hypothetical protein
MTSARQGQGETERLRQVSMMLARLAKAWVPRAVRVPLPMRRAMT